jgi:hypothetical protein
MSMEYMQVVVSGPPDGVVGCVCVVGTGGVVVVVEVVLN